MESGPHLSVPSSQLPRVISTYSPPQAERMNSHVPLLLRPNREGGGGGEAERTRNTPWDGCRHEGPASSCLGTLMSLVTWCVSCVSREQDQHVSAGVRQRDWSSLFASPASLDINVTREKGMARDHVTGGWVAPLQ